MTDLATIQQKFVESVLTDSTNKSINEPERLDIYKHNYSGAIRSAMQLTYPVVERLVGEEFFAAMVAEFRRAHTPLSTNLDDYGVEFSDFIANFEPAASLPYLSEVATLEWVHHKSAIAEKTDKTVHPQDLQTVTEQDYASMVITFHPSVYLTKSEYPVDKIWSMNQPDADPTEGLDLDDEKGAYLLLSRLHLKVDIHTLDEASYWFFSGLMNEKPLLDAYQDAAATDETFNLLSAMTFALSNGLLSQFVIKK